jgi:CheY-like chemotaxis protein
MQGGTVTAASAGSGMGSTFTIRLPLCEMPIAPPKAASAAVPRSRRVLIVDDNKDAADSLAELLQISGHQTTVAYSAESALEEFKRNEPQVVLLDLGLPQLDGYEVARRIRQSGSSARLIALSGYGRPQDRERAALAGFDSHLTKPVDLASLEAALGQVEL